MRPTTTGPGGLLPLDGHVSLRPGVLGERQQVNAEHGLEHGWRMLEAAGTTANFAVAAHGGAYSGDSYLDSDVYKWLEAVSWQRQRALTGPVARAFGRALDLLEAAQLTDGYLNTYVQVHAPGWRWAPTNRHEFYNLSHLIQAGVAAARSGSHGDKDSARLFEIAMRAADQLERACTGKANTWNVGHPGIEMALTELYRTTGEERYLDLAYRLLEFRGERKDVLVGSGLSDWEDVLLPMPWDPELTGHAVCAVYLAAGMADLLAERGERRIEEALDAKWQDMMLRKSYLTGNVGSRHAGEALGAPYELPAGRAYCETCAGIGILMWCWRMLLLRGEARYADRFEQALYNSVLCGVGLRGDRFFYANPLADPGEMERLPWYRCSCCPTNVMRLLAQLEHYIATQDGEGIQVHQYTPARITATLGTAGSVELSVETGFPLDGAVRVRVDQPGTGEWALSIRQPAWCADDPTLLVNGAPVRPADGTRPGYLTVWREWAAGDVLTAEFPMRAGFVEADWRSHDQRGTLAVVRGPLVYCAEGHDQPGGLDLTTARILAETPLRESRRTGPLGEHVIVHARMRRADYAAGDALYRPWSADSPASSRATLAAEEEELALIPYFLWANRGRSPMRVWHDVALSGASS